MQPAISNVCLPTPAKHTALTPDFALKEATVAPVFVENTIALWPAGKIEPAAKRLSSSDTATHVTVSPRSRTSLAAPAHSGGGSAPYRPPRRRLEARELNSLERPICSMVVRWLRSMIFGVTGGF